MSDTDPTTPGRSVAARSRLRLGLGASVVLLLLGLAAAVLVSAFGAAGASRTIGLDGAGAPSGSPAASADGTPVEPQATGPPATAILVHMLGAVGRPGLYELRDGDRVVDAVAAAGGFTESADQRAVNLARRVVDGEQIYVPVVGEVPAPAATSASPPGSAGAPGQKVNLNTADAAALDTLPGVGPATASSIIAWREENGRFTSVDDLLSVDGIGAKTVEQLRDLVTV